MFFLFDMFFASNGPIIAIPATIAMTTERCSGFRLSNCTKNKGIAIKKAPNDIVFKKSPAINTLNCLFFLS